MHHASKALLVAGLLILGGCSTAPTTEAPAVAADPKLAAVTPDENLMTGSRIPKRQGTDRMLKTVGAQEARDAMDAAPRPMNSQ
ncbi:hypothetical protein [Massilia niastensis]|uniref:hypothetical protein n=1 Tax=Massilia niastensis TaxID=544911 RepID=UPI000361AC08|nr:hypothetical protein [Massilia niastensis]